MTLIRGCAVTTILGGLKQLIIPHLEYGSVRLSKRVIRVIVRSVGEAFITPFGSPAVADNKAVGSVTYKTHCMSTPYRIREILRKMPARRSGAIPCSIHTESSENRSLIRQP